MIKQLKLALHFRKKWGLSWLNAWQSAGWEIFYNKQDKE